MLRRKGGNQTDKGFEFQEQSLSFTGQCMDQLGEFRTDEVMQTMQRFRKSNQVLVWPDGWE